MKVLSLFSGIGGLDDGFIKAGFNVVWANDFDKYAVQTYSANHSLPIVLADINQDQTTYSNVTVGELAYQMFSYLLANDLLTQEDIDKLKTKEYSRDTFKKVVYPVLALSREANRGSSKTFRYYKTPIVLNNITFFISSQWFEESRDDLVCYFRSKMKK